MPGGRPAHQPIRWSLHRAELEFGISPQFIKKGLKANNIKADTDSTYSTKEIATAIFSVNGLEKKAKEARHHQTIDEAEQSRLDLELKRGKLITKEDMRDTVADLVV